MPWQCVKVVVSELTPRSPRSLSGSLSPRAGRYSNVATVARHARASYAVACQAWRIEPIPRSETSLKIMSGYLCVEQMNSTLCMQWSHKAHISSALQGGIIQGCAEGGGNALYIHQSRVLNEIMRPEYRVQQCVANVLVWMSKLLQLISPIIHPFTQTVTKEYLSKTWVHTISGS